MFSSTPGEIASITEGLLNLISPLSWMCIYIPLMPMQEDMWLSIHATMPYIIGFSRIYKDRVKK